MKLILALLFGLFLGILVSQVGILSTQNAVAQTEAQERYDPTGKKMYWERVKSDYKMDRSYVPGGWLIVHDLGVQAISITFYPDPNHSWQPAVKEGAPWGK